MKVESVSFSNDLKKVFLYVYNNGVSEEEILKVYLHNWDYTPTSNIPSRKIGPKEFMVIEVEVEKFDKILGALIPYRVDGTKSSGTSAMRVFPSLFPVGVYGGDVVLRDDLLTMEALELGFDTLVTGLENLEKAEKYGFKVIAYTPRTGNQIEVAQIEKYLDNDTIIAWYLIDEPDIWEEKGTVPKGWTISQAKRLYKVDKRHRIYIVLCKPFIFEKYAHIPDVLAVDPYPVPSLPLTHVSYMVDRGIETAQPKPVWLIPQAFRHGKPLPNGKWWWNRFPKPEEERLMVYLGLSHGAKGVIYFTYGCYLFNERDPVEGLVSRHPDAQELKREIACLSGELHALGELLEIGYRVKGSYLRHSRVTHGAIEVNQVICGQDTLIIFLVNHDYEITWKNFEAHAKHDLEAYIRVPQWFEYDYSNTLTEEGLIELTTRREYNTVSFKVDEVKVAKTIILTKNEEMIKKIDSTWRKWRRY